MIILLPSILAVPIHHQSSYGLCVDCWLSDAQEALQALGESLAFYNSHRHNGSRFKFHSLITTQHLFFFFFFFLASP